MDTARSSNPWLRRAVRSGRLVTMLTILVGPTAAAQTPSTGSPIEELVVTARRIVESQQKVPVAITALSETRLQNTGIDRLEQVFDYIPNAAIAGGIGGTLQGQISIRGISTLVRIIGIETGVGIYVDGVFQGRPENFSQELPDVQQVEILRGPQGDLFGRNTIAGAVNVITKRPGDKPAASMELQGGSEGLFRARGYALGPIIPGKLSGKIAGAYVRRGGFYVHLSGGQDLETLNMGSARTELRWTGWDKFDISLRGDVLIDRGEPVFFQPRDIAFLDSPVEVTPFTTDQNRPNFLDRDIWGVSLNAVWDLGDTRVTAVSAFRKSAFDASLDDDHVQVDFFIDEFSDETDLFTQELRLDGRIADRITYVAGAYWLSQYTTSDRPFALGSFLSGGPELPLTQAGSVDTRSVAGFANVIVDVTDRLSLAGGLRYTAERREATYLQVNPFGIAGLPDIDFRGRRSDDDVSPTASLSYQATDTVLLYVRYANGFKSSGFNTDFAPSADNLVVMPENATTYEAGVKADLLGQRLRANLSGFHTDHQDLQVSQIVGNGVLLGNAAQAGINGAEVELSAAPSDGWLLTGSMGWLDATYDSFPGCPPSAGRADPDCAGNRLVLAPEWTAAAAATFRRSLRRSLEAVAHVDWNYRSRIFFDSQNTSALSGTGRHLIGARVGLAGDRWEATLWVENLTDRTYVTFADDRSAIGIPLTNAFGDPRTYGATLRARF